MLRCAAIGFVLLLTGSAAPADEIVTDANIVTGLDISNSIDLDDIALELDGVAQAIQDPRVLRAIQAGRHGRIGFVVFAWHHNDFPSVVAWTIIASRDDALAVAREIETRALVDVELEGRERIAWYIGRLTDLSQAIDHAQELLRAAPFKTGRSVINIVGNGSDNVGDGASLARDRVVAAGGTINGMVLGDDAAALDYYREQVIGGPGAFVTTTGDAETLADAFVRKFIGDIVAENPVTVDMAQANTPE